MKTFCFRSILMSARAGSLFAAALLLSGSLMVAAAQDNAQLAASTSKAAASPLESILSNAFEYRNLGPFRAGSWCTCVAVPDSPEHEHLYTFYVGTRNGGVLKTTNNGTTFESVFDEQDHLSIGALAVASTDANQVWAGTGDQAQTRSTNPGAGVYKSMDAGKTWKFMGLKDSEHISRIVVHPTNPNIVWVAAMGHLWSQNEERGIFKTTDGGATWKKVLYIDDKTGAIDLVINKAQPDIIYAAMFECIRYPWFLHDGGPGSGLYKSSDGGENWKKSEGGFPGGEIGRIGIDMFARNPNILYAIVDNHNPYNGPPRARGGRGGRGGARGANASTSGTAGAAGAGGAALGAAGGAAGGRRGRGGRGRGATAALAGAGAAANEVASQTAATTSATSGTITAEAAVTPAAGPARGGARGQSGAGSNWTGGQVYKTEDGGVTWHLTSGATDLSGKAGYSFNQLRIDTSDPNILFVTSANLQRSIDGGQTFVGAGGGGGAGGAGRGGNADSFTPYQRAFGDWRSMWIDPQDSRRSMTTSDGGVFISYDGGRTCIHCSNMKLGEVYALCVDMEDPYNIYAGLQDHESWKGPVNGWSGSVGIEDWATVGIGDGMYNQVVPTDNRWLYNNQEFGSIARVDQKEKTRTIVAPRRPQGQIPLRYNWTSPIALSHFDPKVVYTGAQVLWRSKDRGDNWEEISPDLTTNNPEKFSPPGSSVQYCTLTTISESPLKQGMIWTGSDDGVVQLTQDDGKTWTNCTAAIEAAGGPADAWVTRVLASSAAAGTAYVTKSRLRQDDYKSYVYKTSDFGAHWTAITNGLPERSANVIVEDKVNPNLLFAGTHGGVYVSLDAGTQWTSLRGNMPLAPVYDMTIHPREGDLVVGTYGRGVWVTNVVPLREMNDDTFAKAGDLFTPPARGRRAEGAFGNYRLYGNSVNSTPNDINGIPFTYYLKEATGGVSISIADASGQTVATLNGPGNAGLNQVYWMLGAGTGGGRGGRGGGAGGAAAAGEYKATMIINGTPVTRNVKVLAPKSAEEGRSIDENYNPDLGRDIN